jgi:rRNA-processing protein FCF1
LKIVQIPNLPASDITTVIIDGRVSENIKRTLLEQGISVILTMSHPDVYPAVAYHPDIMLHHIEENLIVYAPNTPEPVINKLSAVGFELKKGETFLEKKYPYTITYNVARVGKYAFHNTKYTDPVLKDLLLERDIKFIHVNQGYSKCLICIVDQNSIITSDPDINKKAAAAGMDVLLIEPDESIMLEPYDMGFLGGASGLIGKNKLAFTGNLVFHKNFKQILDFLSLKHVDVVMLNDGRLIDLGTIMPILQK